MSNKQTCDNSNYVTTHCPSPVPQTLLLCSAGLTSHTKYIRDNDCLSACHELNRWDDRTAKNTDVKISRHIIVGIIKVAVSEMNPGWIRVCHTSAAVIRPSLFKACSEHDTITEVGHHGQWEGSSTRLCSLTCSGQTKLGMDTASETSGGRFDMLFFFFVPWAVVFSATQLHEILLTVTNS